MDNLDEHMEEILKKLKNTYVKQDRKINNIFS